MKTEDRAVLQFPEPTILQCPKCGYEAPRDQYPTITVTLSGHAGSYCMRCWAAWLEQNIPKVKPKEASE